MRKILFDSVTKYNTDGTYVTNVINNKSEINEKCRELKFNKSGQILQEACNGEIVVDSEVDNEGRVIANNYMNGRSVRKEFDEKGNMTLNQLHSGESLRYEYLDDGKHTKLWSTGNSEMGDYSLDYFHDDKKRLVKIEGDSETSVIRVDNFSVKEIDHDTMNEVVDILDAHGRRISTVSGNNIKVINVKTYDNINTKDATVINHKGHTSRLEYDDRDNLVKATRVVPGDGWSKVTETVHEYDSLDREVKSYRVAITNKDSE